MAECAPDYCVREDHIPLRVEEADGVFSITLGITVWIKAQHDLAKMDQGVMETEGERDTLIAKDYAAWAMFLSLLMIVIWGVFWITDNNWLWCIHILVDGMPDKRTTRGPGIAPHASETDSLVFRQRPRRACHRAANR